MQMIWKLNGRAWVVFVMMGFAGCASSPEPFEYHDERDQKSGPGLFSGEKGGYVISSESSEQGPDAEKTQPDPE